jgi:dipeptidyl aminopeptidase/acylaminoacyl peptidase
MILDVIKYISSTLAVFSVLLVTGPTVGELLATMAPVYPYNDRRLLNGLGIPYEEVSFRTDIGLMLRGWYFPAETPDAPAIVYAPATARDQRSGLSLVRPLHQAGYSVLLFSYRGHGHSDGDRFGFTYGAQESKDVDAAVAYLAEARGIRQIGAIGHSAGAVSVILSAARNPHIGALVAASPFPSMQAIWYANRPWYFPKSLFELTFKFAEWRKRFSRHEVQPQDVIGQIAPRPILMVHSLGDKRITPEQAQGLFDAASEPSCLWLVEDASHAEVRSVVLEEQIQGIIHFFDHAFGRSAEDCEDQRIKSGG